MRLRATRLTAICNAVRKLFNPADLFKFGEQGLWLDPSDFSTMFQDAAGTTPVTAVEQPVGKILDKSGRGNHAFQTTATSRPVLSARVNALTATNILSTQSVTTSATTYTLYFSGTGAITLTGSAAGVYTAGTYAITCTAGTLIITVAGLVAQADLRPSNSGASLPPYQSVTSSTVYDTAGFPLYLKFDGIDDFLVTSGIDFTATDKMTVWAGVRKIGSGTAVFAELSANTNSNNGAFGIYCQNAGNDGNDYAFANKGTVVSNNTSSSSFAPPITNVISCIGDIPAPMNKLRINGGSEFIVSATQGAGNYGNHAFYIGRRGGTFLSFNGNIYQLIVRGAQTSASDIGYGENFTATKTGVVL